MSGNERRLVESTPTPTAVPPASTDPGVPGGFTLAEDIGSSDGDMSTRSAGPSNNGAQPAKSRRRRRPPESGNQSKNQMFYFVDSNSSSKEKRAHVMRHHVQEKRKQRKLSNGTVQPDQTQGPASPSFRKDSGYDTDTRREAALTGQPGSAASQESLHHIRFSNPKPSPQPTAAVQSGVPMTMLDASRKDPFSSLPIVQDPEDLELVDYWTSKLTYWSGQNSHLKNQIFRAAMQHPVSFQAVILAYCARWKAQLHGFTDSKEVRRHVGQARKNIADATIGALPVPEDQLAMTMAGMALGEERFGNKTDARVYLDQAIRVLRPRSGLNMGVEVFVQYVRYIMSPPPGITMHSADWRWLVTFLRGAEELMRKHSSPDYLQSTPQRREAFQMESPLFPLLSSGPRPSQVPHEFRVYVVRDDHIQEVSRSAALIFITAALWDFKDSADKTGRFLDYLRAIVEQHQLDRHPACETLLWLLLEQGCESDLRDPERAWSAGELLITHRLLRPDLQFQFNEILMSFLSLRTPIRGIEVFEQELQADVSRSFPK